MKENKEDTPQTPEWEEIAKRVDDVVEDILIAFTNVDTEKEMREYIREAIKNLIK